MMTSRMVENRRRQKASSTHKSLQPCGEDKNRNVNAEMDFIRLEAKFTFHLYINKKRKPHDEKQHTTTNQ